MSDKLKEEKSKSSIQKLKEEKLRLEIKELSKSWFKNPGYLQVLLPSLIALGSVVYAFQSDLISAQREKNELKEMQLKDSIAKFETRKTELQDTLNFLKVTRDSLTDRVAYMQEYYNTEIMIKASQSGDFIEEIENQKDRIRVLKSNLEKLEFNLKILKNTPFLNQSDRDAIKVWEEKNMNEYEDSVFIAIQGSFLGTKKYIRKRERKDSVLKEYSAIQPKSN